MYFAFKVNTYQALSGIIGFTGDYSSHGYLLHMTCQSTTGIAFDWLANGVEYGYNTSGNSNFPLFPFVVGQVSHMFLAFDRTALKYNMYIYNSAGAQTFSMLNKSYPANVFSSNAGPPNAFTLFTLGNNTYALGYSAVQTVVFFNFYESVLTTTQMAAMVADTA